MQESSDGTSSIINPLNGADICDLPSNALSLVGTQGAVVYRDVAGTGQFSTDDPIWEDLHGDQLYHSDDPVLYNPDGVQLTDGVTFGKTNGLGSFDIGTGTPLIALNYSGRNFRTDFAYAFELATGLCSSMADPDCSTQQWSLGGVLNTLGTTPESTITGATVNIGADGSISYDGGTRGPESSGQVQLGDWASSVGYAGDGNSLNSPYDNYHNPLVSLSSSQPLVTRNWTLIPATPATANTPALAYAPGMPNSQSLVFPVQFQELRDVLEELSTATPWTYVYPGQGATLPSPNPPPPPLPGTALNIAEPPTDPIPLTTAMDYFNVVPDSNLDGLVQVPQDLTSLENETGSIAMSAASNMPTTYLPLVTTSTLTGGTPSSTLPLYAYLEQGAFGTSADSEGTLSAESLWTYSDASPTGSSFAFSLDTRIQLNMCVNDGQNHILELEVIRPGGNAVEFNFPWNPATSSFSTIGTPGGWNSRDADRTYVLRDLGEGTSGGMDVEYALEFASGIDQVFGAGPTFLPNGDYLPLVYVTDPEGMAAIVSGADSVMGGFSESGPSAVIPTPQYTVTLQWTDGQIAGVQYQSTSDPNMVIETKVNYESGTFDVQSLEKHEIINGVDQGVAADISYVVINASEIMYGVDPADALEGNATGITVTRDGSFVPNSDCTVTLTTTVPNVVGYQKEEFSFNSDGLIAQDTVVLSEDGTNESTATTSYSYLQSRSRYDNGAPLWGKVSKIVYPNYSWEEFTYQTDTGWLYQDVTPYESGIPDAAEQNVVQYAYEQNLSGSGEASDSNELMAEPTEVAHYVAGVMVREEFDQWSYGLIDYSAYNVAGPSVVTRMAATAGASWSTGVLQSTTVRPNYRSIESVSGTAGYSEFMNFSSDSQIMVGLPSYSIGYTWVSYSGAVLDGFGDPTSSESWGIGQPYETDTSNSQDPFGRSTSDTASGGVTTSASYTNADGTTSWFGPASTTAADGSVTNYTYTIAGQVATKIIYAGSSHSVEYSYVYDAGGNMVKQTQTPVNASGTADGTPLVTTYAYDAQGRLTKEVDNAGGTDVTANRTTTYDYATFDGTYNTTTVTYPDGSTQITKTYLDGTTASVSGTAATPETDSEGVVSQDTTDANGKVETAGSTWTMISTNGGADWTTTYSNMLGQVYLMQQSTPTGSANPYVDSTTTYNANGQAIETVDFNGTATYTLYDPSTGQVGATWADVNGDGVYTPGIDTKTVYTPTPFAYNASTPAGVDTQTLSATGVQDDDQLTWNGGLNSSDTVDGMTTTTQTIYNGNGSYTVLTTNPDGTQVQDIYNDGLLTEEDQLDSGEGLIAKTTYTYNGMRQLATQTDNTGTTVYAYFQDGTQKSVTPPGQPATTANTLDSSTEDPTNVTNPDGSTTSQTENGLGETLTQSGADVLGATYGYNGNGQITSLTTAAGTTNWAYDPDSGALQSETFADGTSDTYQYNADGQMTGLTEPGVSGTFRYDAYGDLTDSTYNDSSTGLVQSTVNGEDDQGRPVVTTDTDNGQTSTETDAYNSVGDLQSETFGSAGNTSVSYGYYGAGATAGSNGGDSDALQSLTASTPGGQSASQSYTYDSAGRLESITVNGIVISYSDAPNSDQVDAVGASPAGANLGQDFVSESYSPDSADGSRLSSISVGAGNSQGEGQVYDAGYGYNNDDQIASDQISQTDSGGNTTTQSLNYTYNPNEADALTQVTDGSGNVLYNYSYDGTGDFTGNSTLGTANNVDEYSNLTYNARHDLTNDGTYTYGYDALDRLISITPDNPTSGMLSAQYGYDDQGRMLWENVYGYTGSAWGLSTTYHYVWSGDELIEKLDANNNVLQQYTWGTGWNGQDQVIALTDFTQGSPTTYLLSYDASGNVTMLLNPTTGQVVANYSYSPYGQLVSASGSEAGINPFLGKGYWTDTAVDPMLGFAQPDTADGTTRETNLSLGLWLQNDPTGFNGGFNPTSVDSNDPIDLSDANGTSAGTVGTDQVNREAVLEVTGGRTTNLTDAEVFKIQEVYNAKVAWYKARDITAVIPPDPNGGPVMGYVPPTTGAAVKQYAKEVQNAVNNNTAALINLPATVINNEIYAYHTNYTNPVFEDRSGVYQLPIFTSNWEMDYNADPDADKHVQNLTSGFGATFTLFTYWYGAEGGTIAVAGSKSAPIVESGMTFPADPVTWVEETTGMRPDADRYGAGAAGARVNAVTKARVVPQLGYARADGSLQMVRFDGYEDGVLIDRKLGVVNSPRGYDEATRQSTALLEHNLTGRWEVPNEDEALVAQKMFDFLGITNISVKVVTP